MKKQIALLAAAALAAGAAAAFGGALIKDTAHDLSGAKFSTNPGADEICIYCHTPHNPVSAVPLWNRYNPTDSRYTLYKNSPTLTNAAKNTAFADNSVSLFCMSCHDGVTALGNIKNAMGHNMNTAATAANIISNANNDRLGTNLSNSHPVGFDYSAASSQDSTLFPLATAASNLGSTTGGSYPFFSTTDGLSIGTMMECASCHKVHNDEYGKFLRKNNTGSALCIACHNK